MKILHTSDWHLGASLHGQKRYDEFDAFIKWFLELLKERNIDILIISGDIFDTAISTNRAHKQYYDMLMGAKKVVRHIVVTGGNHDSPSFLNAPVSLLKTLGIHIIGSAPINPEDGVISLCDADGSLEAIICAVPYLRSRDIDMKDDEEISREERFSKGVAAYYEDVYKIAVNRRGKSGGQAPLFATGHLYATGATEADKDRIKEGYVGNLSSVSVEDFIFGFDYVALGHIHTAQKVGGRDNVRYSGSPLTMSFSEAGREKKLIEITFSEGTLDIEEIAVPVFYKLIKLTGDMAELRSQVKELVDEGIEAGLFIEYTGGTKELYIHQEFAELTGGTKIKLFSTVVNLGSVNNLHEEEYKTLEELTPSAIFDKILQAERPDKGEEEKKQLKELYREVLLSLDETDEKAE